MCSFAQAYPCDICHDNNEDHEHEWATRMICGFCSVEQAFANGKPCSCGKALTKGGASAHWEASHCSVGYMSLSVLFYDTNVNSRLQVVSVVFSVFTVADLGRQRV